MKKEYETKNYESGIEQGIYRMNRWYICQKIGRCLLYAGFSDIELRRILSDAEVGIFKIDSENL